MHSQCDGLVIDFRFNACYFLGRVIDESEEHPAFHNVDYVPDQVVSEVAVSAETALAEVAVAEISVIDVADNIVTNPMPQGRLHVL